MQSTHVVRIVEPHRPQNVCYQTGSIGASTPVWRKLGDQCRILMHRQVPLPRENAIRMHYWWWDDQPTRRANQRCAVEWGIGWTTSRGRIREASRAPWKGAYWCVEDSKDHESDVVCGFWRRLSQTTEEDWSKLVLCRMQENSNRWSIPATQQQVPRHVCCVLRSKTDRQRIWRYRWVRCILPKLHFELVS